MISKKYVDRGLFNHHGCSRFCKSNKNIILGRFIMFITFSSSSLNRTSFNIRELENSNRKNCRNRN